MNITRLYFVETGTYNDMALRPYQTNVDTSGIAQLQEATNFGANLKSAAVAGVAGSILRPSAEAKGIVSIVNSWDTPRLRFVMEVVNQAFAGGESVQYLTGYTDYVGVSASDHLDPRMRLYINNSILTRRVVTSTPRGMESVQTVSDASHILAGSYQPSYNNINNTPHTMRPEDVFANIGSSAVMGDVVDLRTTFAQHGLKKSRRSNGAASSYLSRVLSAHSQTLAGSDNDEDIQGLMAASQASVREALITQDPTIGWLQRSGTSLVEGTSISYGELCGLCPGLDDRVVVAMARGIAKTQNHSRGQSEIWSGTTNETVFSTILSHSVPGIMMDLMMQKMTFSASNQTLDGQFFVQFAEVKSFAQGIDLAPYVQHFEHRLRTEILSDLTRNNAIDIQLTGSFDVLGDTTIDISISGGPMIRYVTPSFCDALLAPVLANDSLTLRKLAHDMDALVDNLQVNYSPANSNYPTPFTQEKVPYYGHSETV